MRSPRETGSPPLNELLDGNDAELVRIALEYQEQLDYLLASRAHQSPFAMSAARGQSLADAAASILGGMKSMPRPEAASSSCLAPSFATIPPTGEEWR